MWHQAFRINRFNFVDFTKAFGYNRFSPRRRIGTVLSGVCGTVVIPLMAEKSFCYHPLVLNGLTVVVDFVDDRVDQFQSQLAYWLSTQPAVQLLV